MPRKKEQEHVNLERWMVSYADFMTLLFAVFVVLYAFAMAKQSDAQSMAQSVAQAFNENLVTASGGVLLIPGSLEEIITQEAQRAQEQSAATEPMARSEESGGTIMNFTSSGSPDSDSPNSSGGIAGEDEGQSGQSSVDKSYASGELIVSDNKTRSKGSPHTELPTGGSDSGAGGFTPGGDSNLIAEGGRSEIDSESRGEGVNGTPFDAVRKSITDSLSESGMEQGVEIEEDEHWLTLSMNSGMLFAEGSASILTSSRPLIARMAVALSGINNYVRVRGYTDDTFIPNGIFKNSWELAARRAVNVLVELENDGIDPARMAVESYGQFHPFASNDTRTGRALNRRVVIAVSRYAMVPDREARRFDDDREVRRVSEGSAGDGNIGITRSEDDSIMLDFSTNH